MKKFSISKIKKRFLNNVVERMPEKVTLEMIKLRWKIRLVIKVVTYLTSVLAIIFLFFNSINFFSPWSKWIGLSNLIFFYFCSLFLYLTIWKTFIYEEIDFLIRTKRISKITIKINKNTYKIFKYKNEALVFKTN